MKESPKLDFKSDLQPPVYFYASISSVSLFFVSTKNKKL